MYRSRVGTHPQETKHNFLNGVVTSKQLLYWSCNSGLCAFYARLLQVKRTNKCNQISLADLLANLWVNGNRSGMPYPFTQTYAQYSVNTATVRIMRSDTENVASHLSVHSVAEQSKFTVAFRHIDQSRMCTVWRLKRECWAGFITQSCNRRGDTKKKKSFYLNEV